MKRDLKEAIFYRPVEVAALFRHDEDLKWVYRMASYGFLKPYARRFGRMLLFSRDGIDQLTGNRP